MGSTFDNLTKAGVSQGGKTSYYDTKGEAGQAIAAKSAPLAQPNNFTFDGASIEPKFFDLGGGSELPTPLHTGEMPGGGTDVAPSIAPPSPVTATASTPTVNHADIPKVAPTTSTTPLTTKGEILKAVLQGLVGAGAAVGSRTGGEGFARGLAANQSIENDIDRKRSEDLNNQLRQSQIDNIPIVAAQRQAELDRIKAQTVLDTAKANRGDFMYSKKGIVNIGPHGDFRIVPGTEPDEKPSLEDNAEGRKKIIESLKAQPGYALTPREEQLYIATGTKPPAEKKIDALETAYRSIGVTDPSKATPEQAKQALGLYSSATKPNYAPGNAEAKTTREDTAKGNAQTFASKALTKAGGDHMKALQVIDQYVASSKLTPEQAAIVSDARKQIDSEYRASQAGGKGKKDPIGDILNSVLNPQPVAQ